GSRGASGHLRARAAPRARCVSEPPCARAPSRAGAPPTPRSRAPGHAARTPRAAGRTHASARSPSRRRGEHAPPPSRPSPEPLPTPNSAAAAPARRRPRADNPSRSPRSGGRALEMPDVIDPGDDEAAVALFDHGDGCVRNPERKQAAAGPPDDAMNGDLDHAAMSDHDGLALGMALEDRADRRLPARLEGVAALAPRHEVPARLDGPPRPRVRVALDQLVVVQSLPLAEGHLAQLRHRVSREAGGPLDRRRRLHRAPQVAG